MLWKSPKRAAWEGNAEREKERKRRRRVGRELFRKNAFKEASEKPMVPNGMA